MRPDKQVELRARQRIKPQGPRSLFLRLSDFPDTFSINNISYDGVGIDVFKMEKMDIGTTLRGSILYLSNRIEVDLNYAQSSGKAAGFTINYNDPKSLLLMRDLIEPLQNGASLRPVNSGDSSLSINLMGSSGSSIISYHSGLSIITLGFEEIDYFFEWRDGEFSQLFLEKEKYGILPQRDRPEIPKPILEKVYLFLIGIKWPFDSKKTRNEICAEIEKLLHTKPTVLQVVKTKTDS